MKAITVIARILLGLIFVVFGSNTFFHFMKMPLPHGLAGDFMNALLTSGYMNVVAACQVGGGLLLLIGKFVPLGLTLLGPVIVNILCFHIFLNPEGLPLALGVAVLALFLLYRYRSSFAGLLRA